METFFGRVPAEYMDSSGDYFFNADGGAYYYKATLCNCDEQVILQDTAGRYVPIDMSSMKDAAMAFAMLAKRIEAEEKAQEAYDEVLDEFRSEIVQNVQDWNELRA